MSKINTEIIKNRCVSLIADLKKLASEFAAYNKKAAEIEGRTELTREYKDSQLTDERQRLGVRARTIFDDMYEVLDQMAEAMKANDSTFDFSDPEFASCIALMSASEKPLPGETILGITEKFLGNRQALLALIEVAKGSNKQTLQERIVDSDVVMAALRDKVEDLDLGFPKTAYLIPDIRSRILKVAKGCGQELTEQESDCGTDYQEIVNLQMRAAMGLLN